MDEQIRLVIDESQAIAAADRANRAIEKVEDKTSDLNNAMQQSVTTAARSVATITDRSQQSILRLVESAERLAARSSQGAVAGLETQRNQIIRRLGGQQELIERVNTAYGRLITTEQNREASLRAEQGAKRQLEEEALAARQAKNAQEELARAEKARTEELKREGEALERTVRLLERKAQLAGKSGSARVEVERQQFLGDNVKLDPSQVERVNSAFSKLNQTQAEGTVQSKLFAGTLAGFAPQLLLVQAGTAVFEKLVGLVKEGSVESAKYAARTEQLGFAQRAVARASGLNAFALEKEVEQIEKLGITQQNARLAVSRFVTSQLDFTRASELARIAQDTGRLANISSSEAFERLTTSIVTAQPEMLRTLGIQVNFETVYAKTARALNKTQNELSETEKIQARFNAVTERAILFSGTYEASNETAAGQALSLARAVDNLRQAIGERLLPIYGLAVSASTKFLEVVTGSVPTISNVITIALSPYTVALKTLSNVIEAIPDRDIKLTINGSTEPKIDWLEEVASRIRGFLTDNTKDIEQMNREAFRNVRLGAESAFRLPGQNASQETGSALIKSLLEKEALTLEGVGSKISSIRSSRENIINDLRQNAGKVSGEDARSQIALILEKGRELKVLEARKDAIEASAKKAEERQKLAEKGTAELFSREEARVFRGGLAGSAFEVKPDDKEFERQTELNTKFEADRLKARIESNNRILQLDLDALNTRLGIERDSLGGRKDLELAELEASQPRTLAAKVALEQKKLEITQRYLVQEAILQAEELARRTDLEVTATEAMRTRDLASLGSSLATGLISQQTYAQRRIEIEESTAAYINAVRGNAAATDEAAQTKAALVLKKTQSESVSRQSRLIEDEYQKTFDKLERGFNGLFDSMENGAKGFASRLKNILLSGLLSPVKQVASNFFANLFTPLVSQIQRQQVGFSGAGPAFAGALGFLTPQNAFESVSRVVGGPGGTGGFAGPVTSIGGKSLGGFGSIAGLATQYRSILTKLGDIGFRQAGDFGGEAPARGIGGAKGGGLLAGGGILVADGLRRGGLVGTLETAAGGALIGAKFGGPIGAGIGAAVGLGAGLLRGLIKSAEQKIIDKVDALYGYRIDKPFAKTLVDLARGSYASNFDLMLASQQAKDLIELWALSNGKSTSQFAGSKQQNLTFSSSNGVLRQLPTYFNGSPLASLLPSPGAQGGPTMVNLSLQLDGKSTEQVLRDGQVQAIISNPRAVQQATVDAQYQNFGKAGALASLLNPSVVPG